MTVAIWTKPVVGSLFWFAALALLGNACNEPGPRVYTARAYDRDARCLDPDEPIGLVEAEELRATCPPVCIELRAKLYVSTICPPFPADSVLLTANESADCGGALSAFSGQLDCFARGKSE